jgi:glycine cleavage system aminomethyltransferase T
MHASLKLFRTAVRIKKSASTRPSPVVDVPKMAQFEDSFVEELLRSEKVSIESFDFWKEACFVPPETVTNSKRKFVKQMTEEVVYSNVDVKTAQTLMLHEDRFDDNQGDESDSDIEDDDEDEEDFTEEISAPNPKNLPPSPLRETSSSVFWSEFSSPPPPLVRIHDTLVPSHFKSALSEYQLAKTDSLLIDESYKRIIKISGADRDLVCDHFLTSPVKKLKLGETRFTCVVDSKGCLLDIGTVLKLSDEILLVLDGHSFDSVSDYLSQYVKFCSESGFQVNFSALDTSDGAILSFYGPKSKDKVQEIFKDFHATGLDETEKPTRDLIFEMPKELALELKDSGGDRNSLILMRNPFLSSYSVIVLSEINSMLEKFLNFAKPGGVYAYDMLRMEEGLPRSGIDTNSRLSPVKASLVFSIDQEKLRKKLLLGHKELLGQLAKPPSQKRVGVVLSSYAHAGCSILSAPERRMIGVLTSCAWSPALKKRVCQGYVKPEYAKCQKPVFISVPLDLPGNLTKTETERFERQGIKRGKFRKLVASYISPFPVTSDNPSNVVPFLGKGTKPRRANPTVEMKREEGRFRKLGI